MAEYKPPQSGVPPPPPEQQDPLAGLLNPNSGATATRARLLESRPISLLPNVTNARLYTMCSRYELPPNTPEMRAWDPAEDQRRRRDSNNLGILFLGPIFGIPAAITRIFDAPESVVEDMGELGLNAASVAGVPGARGPGRVIEPVPTRPVVTGPRNTGVVILKKPPQLDWNAVVPKKGKYKGEKREDHVRRHNTDDKTKDDHGIFNDDGVKLTNEAWQRAHDLGLTPDANGQLTVPMGRTVGFSGGRLGNGSPLSDIRISVRPGTNEIITGYPE